MTLAVQAQIVCFNGCKHLHISEYVFLYVTAVHLTIICYIYPLVQALCLWSSGCLMRPS